MDNDKQETKDGKLVLEKLNNDQLVAHYAASVLNSYKLSDAWIFRNPQDKEAMYKFQNEMARCEKIRQVLLKRMGGSESQSSKERID